MQVATWSIQPFGHNRHGLKIKGLWPFLGGELGPHLKIMWHGPRPNSTSSGILIHPTVWQQYTNVTDRNDRETMVQQDRANRLQTVAQKPTVQIQELSSCWDGRPCQNKVSRKVGRGLLCPSVGGLGTHLIECCLGQGLSLYQVASWSIQQCAHNRHGPNNRGTVVPFFGGGSRVPI